VRPDLLVLAGLLPLAAHFGWQVWRLSDARPEAVLVLFRSNRSAGLLLFAACAVAATAG
jgi:4-hydroxybenzoate polyprenyltransferase